MKKISMFVCVISIFLTGAAWSAEKVIIKYGNKNPLQSNVMVEAYVPWVENMNQASQGAFKIDIFPGGVLSRDPQQSLEQLANGVTDIIHLYLPNYPGQFSDEIVFNMPFVINNAVEGSKASWNMYAKGILRGFETMKVLSHSTTDIMRLHTNFPVKTPADLKGHKIRASGKFQVDMIKSLGAVPVAMPTQDCAENMARGLIEGVLCDTSALYTFRINDVANYYLDIPLGTVGVAEVMNKKIYDSLSSRGKIAIDMYMGAPIVLPLSHQMKGDADKGIEIGKKDPKTTVYTPTEAEKKQWEAAIDPVVRKWISETPNGEALLTALKKELEWIRAGGIGGAPCK